MGLVVWLPLLGNLNNQGTSAIQATGSNVTVNANGKLGSCYSFTSSNYSYIKLSEAPFDNTTEEFSYCCWVKLNDTSTSTCLFSNRNETSYKGISIFLNNSGNILFYTGASISWAQTIAANVWTHLAFVYKKGVTKDVYINGTLAFHTMSNTALTAANTTYAFIGASQYNATTANANYMNGFLNDVRIYDHALSVAEIHEISQGLILHYKLDQPANINNNLYVGSEKFTGTWGNSGSWGESTETYQNFTVRQRGSTWSGLYQDIPCSQNDIFTISFYGKIVSGGVICSVHRSNLGNVTTGLTILGGNFIEGTNWVRATDDGTQWKRYWATVQIASADITYLRWRIENSVSGKTFQICGLKLERGNTPTPWSPAASEAGETNIIRDSSGYNRNGTNTDLCLNTDTARYSASTLFNGTTSTITIANQGLNKVLNGPCTISFWAKHISESGGRSIYFSSYNGSPFWCLEKSTGNAFRYDWNGSVDKYSASNLLVDNVWQHICLSREGTAKASFYLNGQLKTEFTTATTDLSSLVDTWRIGRDVRTNDGTPFHGCMSDFRIYCTALSAADVKQLYEMGAKVDNKQNLHTYEIKETNNNLLAGKVWTSAYGQRNPLTNPFINFNSNGEYQFTANSTSAGSAYIPINPTGHTYEYDYTISVNAGNQFYIGFERFDANKTSRSNSACTYTYATKPSANVVKQHFKGTVDLSTDGVNPCAFIALRILNGWSGTNSGVTGTATIHSFSLREIGTKQQPKLTKQGQFIEEELKEETNMKLHKNGIVETNNLIEI